MDLSYEDVQNILKIIDGSSLEELHLEIGDLKLVVRKRRGGAAEVEPPAAPAPSPEAAAPAAAVSPQPGPARARLPRSAPPVEGEFELKAPMVGTFYRAPAPGAPPFVEVGSVVQPDDVVCIIEVMKLMNSIRAGQRGRVVEILAGNAQLVEYGQPLIVIQPVG
jgi:acetyl-CoA carboxylase biotin carboxyl carrier protein